MYAIICTVFLLFCLIHIKASKLPVNYDIEAVDKSFGPFLPTNDDVASSSLYPDDHSDIQSYWPFSHNDDANDHLDPWGSSMFTGGLFDSLPIPSSSHDKDSSCQDTLREDEHYENWDPSMCNDDVDDTTLTLDEESNTASLSLDGSENTQSKDGFRKTKDRRGERLGHLERKNIVYEQFVKLHWSPDMDANILAIHASMMQPRGNPRVITEAIEEALSCFGANKSYIEQFKKHRQSQHQKRYKLHSMIKPIESLTVEQQNKRKRVIEKLEECNIDIVHTSIYDLEVMTRSLNDLKMTNTMYDDILRDLVFYARGLHEAFGFKLFRKRFRDAQGRKKRGKKIEA